MQKFDKFLNFWYNFSIERRENLKILSNILQRPMRYAEIGLVSIPLTSCRTPIVNPSTR